MTNEERREIVKEAERVRKYEQDWEEIVRMYPWRWIKALIIILLINVAGFSWLLNICKTTQYLDLLIGLLIIFSIILGVVGIWCNPDTRTFHGYSSRNGGYDPKRHQWTILLKIPYYFACGFPMMKLCYSWFELPFWISFFSPVIFAVFCLFYGITHCSKPGYYSKDPGFTQMDLQMLKNDLEMAGIDPNKFPSACLDDKFKEMTLMDWQLLRNDLEMAGFDVSLDSKKKKK